MAGFAWDQPAAWGVNLSVGVSFVVSLLCMLCHPFFYIVWSFPTPHISLSDPHPICARSPCLLWHVIFALTCIYSTRLEGGQTSRFIPLTRVQVYLSLSTRPLRRTIHTRRASFVPRRLLDMVTTGDDQTIEIWDHLSQKTLKSNVSFAVYQPILPIIVIGSGGVTV